MKHNESKMCGVKCITFALWINILNVITGENNFKLELTPKNQMIHVGEGLELTCWFNYCPVNVTFMWKSAMDGFHGGYVKSDQTVSRLLIRNYTVKHSNALVCKVTCQGNTQERTSKISVFSFPQDPVLPKIKSLIANQEHQLICRVHNIYPLNMLKIEWLRGNKSLHNDEPDESISDHVRNYSSVFNYTPSVDDLGKNISCKATLKLNGQERITTAKYGPGTITFSSDNTSVMLGGNLEITCYADGNPKPTISWWKLGETKTESKLQNQNDKLIINNASWSQAGWYRCDAKNDMGSQQTRIKVIVLGPPNIPKIQLSHTEEPKEGDNISIFCSSGGGPAQLKLYRQSQSAAAGGANESSVLLNISSIQTTHAGIYICEAKNDFGTERSTINITVKAQHRILTTPDLAVAIVPAVGSVSLLTAAGLLIRYCRKKAKSISSNITLS